MKKRFVPYAYQERAIKMVESHPRCLLFLDMGLGKTVSTLTAIQHLWYIGEVSKVLVIAPKMVADTTWRDEVDKWDHLFLRTVRMTGTKRQRERAMDEDGEIYVLSRNNVVWLLDFLTERKRAFPFDMVVLDELTSFKNHQSLRFKALKKLTTSKQRIVGLTGTPTPKGLIDLWAQVYCVDRGKRLGLFITKYRQRWFNEVIRNNIPIKTWPKEGAEEEILSLLKDISLTMRSSDYLSLPDKIEITKTVELPEAILKKYRKFKNEKVLEALKEGDQTTAASAAVLIGKLAQFADGAVYTDGDGVEEIHKEKLTALGEILESTESPVLCFYQFQHDMDRIMKEFGSLGPKVYTGQAELREWNEGKIRLLLAHPASAAFGLNMQYGGNVIVWFSTGWNLEYYQQGNARLHRQGQSKPVLIYRIIVKDTVDEDMLASIESKETNQNNIIKRLIESR